MKSVLLLICILVGLCTAGELIPAHDPRIVGGITVDISKFGWQVSLQRNNRHICGASILNNDWVVTAAHCIKKGVNYTIRAGTTIRNTNGSLHQVEQVIVHPDFDPDNDNDVAVLRVDKPFRLNGRTIRRVKLANKEEDVPAGSKVTITGWGALQEGGSSPDKLQAVSVPMVAWEKCKKRYKKLTHNMICAGFEDGGKDSCQGDSGGPLVDENRVLHGIVSFGRGCARPKFPGVYTRVASPSVRNFIRRYTRV